MQLSFAIAFVASTLSANTPNPPALLQPAVLNIGHICRWDRGCMKKQQQAMRRALSYVNKRRPPVWKVQLCNRNASRRRSRVDWIGFNNCIRNPSLRPAPARTSRNNGVRITKPSRR